MLNHLMRLSCGSVVTVIKFLVFNCNTERLTVDSDTYLKYGCVNILVTLASLAAI